jgi:hypothetical protein
MQKVQGFVENGNLVITVGGVSAAQKAQGSYPQAQVAVYLAGTATLASIFADNLATPTPKANPFTAQTNGYFYFYAANGRYDVTFSGGGLAAPLTFGDVLLADPFSGQTNVNSVTEGPGINVAPTTGNVVVTNEWGSVPVGLPPQYVRLKPNVGNNTTFELADPPVFVSKTYKFPPQTPGGTLVVGNNAIIVSPVPLGVNGTNANHYLYVSGGTGAAEACLITGGTAVAGAQSGTIIISCANAHSGAWTIQSATAGIQEAIYSAGQVGNVAQGAILIPAGNYSIYGTITLPYNGCTLRGLGRLVTTLSTTMTSNPLISCPNNADQVTISDFTVFGPNQGGVTTALNFAFNFYNQANLIVERVSIYYFGQGMSFTGRDIVQYNHVSDVFISAITLNGIYIDSAPAAGGSFDNITIAGNASGSTAFRIINGVGGYINSFYTNSVGYGIVIEPGAGEVVSVIDLISGTFDGFGPNSTVGILFQPSGGEVSSIRITNVNSAGFQYGVWIKQNAVASKIEDITITNCGALGNSVGGFELQFGSNLIFQNCIAQGNGTTSTPQPGLIAGGNPTLSNLRVNGGSYAAGSYANHSNSQNYGIVITGGTSNVMISDLNATPNLSGAVFVSGTNPGLIIENVRGYNPVGRSAITPGPSPFTYTAGSSPETVYVLGGTVSAVSIGGFTIATSTSATIALPVPLGPNQTLVVTYTSVPTMFHDVQ